MTTNLPTSSTSNQVPPINPGLPDLTAIPTSTLPNTVLPVVNEPNPAVQIGVMPIAVDPITPVTPAPATPSVELPVVKMPEETMPVVPIITTGPSLEKPAELPGQSLDLSPGLTQKTLPESNPETVVKTLDQLKTTPSQPVDENKRKVKDILVIVGILIAGIVALVFGIYIASNAA